MTEDDIKESLSRSFVRLLANRHGYTCKFDENDYGVDLTIAEVQRSTRPQGQRYVETGRLVQLQLKCTCEASVVDLDQEIAYDLESKTYNDLVDRWQTEPSTPMWLVLLVLPDEPTEWIRIDANELAVRRTAYYWRPEPGAAHTQNSATKRIRIPKAQALSLSFVADRYAEHWGAMP